LDREETRREGDGQLDPAQRVEYRIPGPARGGRRRGLNRRLNRRLRRTPCSRERFADQSNRRLLTARLVCHPRSGRITDHLGQADGWQTIAAIRGTDHDFILLQSLAKSGIDLSSVKVQNLQHADGKTALENGSVDAWAGLDPLLSTSVANGSSKIIYDNVKFNSYGFLDATESFLTRWPDLDQVIVDSYQRARVRDHKSG
jgi:hypothetical protein